MKETPLLFKPEMIRATLREINPKEQTRRLISKLLKFGMITEFGVSDTPGYDWHFRDKRMLWNDISHEMLLESCPYGKVGDRLWVRETCAIYQTVNSVARSGGRSFSEVSDGLVKYRADGFETIDELKDHIRLMSETDFEAVEVKGDKWTPSIFMPRWASRILLEVTAVRVERLQDISEADAKAEGVEAVISKKIHGWTPHVLEYSLLWETINGPGSWDLNPYVWVIEFKRIGE